LIILIILAQIASNVASCHETYSPLKNPVMVFDLLTYSGIKLHSMPMHCENSSPFLGSMHITFNSKEGALELLAFPSLLLVRQASKEREGTGNRFHYHSSYILIFQT